ncbi:MAG: hypothetical protein AAGA93_27740 [Actinomycetota bacterium]
MTPPVIDASGLVADGTVLTVDVAAVARRAKEAAEELFERRRKLTPVATVATDFGKEVSA